MQKLRRQHPFNIIEIALTLAVMGFAMASIMAIFPMGFSVTRDTMTQNYASDIGDQVLSYIQIQANAPPTNLASPNTTSGWATTFAIATWNTPPGRQIPPDPGNNWGDPDPLFSSVKGSDNLFDAAICPHIGNPNRYFKITRSIFFAAATPPARVVEMTAIAHLWCTDSVDPTNPLSSPIRTIFVEVSWPADRSYAERKTLILSKQILKPNF